MQLVDTRLEEKTFVFATKEDVARLEGKLSSQISESKVDIIKWLVGTGIAIVGLLIAFIKFTH